MKGKQLKQKQIKRTHCKERRRIRLIPLMLGGYGAFLGFGLAVIGFAEMKEGIGIIRFLLGLGMAGFGLFGIWDGVRDLVRPNKKPEQAPVSQFVLTDTTGNRSSLVTPELLRKQMDILAESQNYKSFYLQILPPLPVEGFDGRLRHVVCFYRFQIVLAAYFESPKEGYGVYQKSTEPDVAVEWLKQLLAGSPDFSEWESIEANELEEEETDMEPGSENSSEDEGADSGLKSENGLEKKGTDSELEPENSSEDGGINAESVIKNDLKEGTDTESESETRLHVMQEDLEFFWRQLLHEQKGRMVNWHQLLVIFGESWHDEHKFFSARDVELAIEGIQQGKYQKVVLEWGTQEFDMFPGLQSDLMVIWCSNNTGGGDTRFLAREGTVTQVKFWLNGYLERGSFGEMSGWTDITDQIEKLEKVRK